MNSFLRHIAFFEIKIVEENILDKMYYSFSFRKLVRKLLHNYKRVTLRHSSFLFPPFLLIHIVYKIIHLYKSVTFVHSNQNTKCVAWRFKFLALPWGFHFLNFADF